MIQSTNLSMYILFCCFQDIHYHFTMLPHKPNPTIFMIVVVILIFPSGHEFISNSICIMFLDFNFQ